MSTDTTQHTPADVRERVAREVFTLDADWRREYWDQFRRDYPQQAQAYYDTADRILALLRTPRGGRSALWWAANELVAALEGRSTLTVQQCITGVKRLLAEADLRTPRGEGEASGLAECITCMGCGQDFDPDDDAQARYHEAACEVVDYEPARVEIARRLRGAALRSEAQWEEEPVAWLVERRGVEMFGWHPVHVYLGKQNAENIARVLRDGEWDVRVVPLYRATRRSEAQEEDRWEDLVFGPITEAYNEAHAARRGKGGGDGE